MLGEVVGLVVQSFRVSRVGALGMQHLPYLKLEGLGHDLYHELLTFKSRRDRSESCILRGHLLLFFV